MKKILALILSIIILILCCACGSSKPTIEGDWHQVSNGYWYYKDTNTKYHKFKFSDGHIYSESNVYKITYDGKKLAGFYETSNNLFKAYIHLIHGTDKNIQPLYLIKYKDTYAITTEENNTDKIIFCRSFETAKELSFERYCKREDTLRTLNKIYNTMPNFNANRATKALLTNDFNHTTNQVIDFGENTFEFPNLWNVDVVEGGTGVFFQPDKEIPPIFSLLFLNVDGKANFQDINDRRDFAEGILSYYITELYKDVIEEFTLEQCYVPPKKNSITKSISPLDILYIAGNAKIKGKPCYGLIKVRYYGDGICTFNLFQNIDSTYDFTQDMEHISDTIKSTEYANYKSYNNSANKNQNNANLLNLDVSFIKDYIDGNKMYLKVYVKNNSSDMFKGDIHVFFYSADGKKRLGSDMIIVDKLMPGQTSWAKVKIDKYLGTPKIETKFTNPQFLDVSPISTEIDTTLTEKTSNSVRLNFDVASWYKNIESIKVMTDRTCIVTSSSHKDNSIIGSAVWSCGKDHGVKTVQVIDTDGNIKAVYP